jgi:ATP-dependent DNA helicase RecG
MNNKPLLEQIQKGESQTIEFKTTFQKEVIESIVAFANAQGGKIFIGISDNGNIVGVELKQETLQNWINQIKISTSPSVIPDLLVENIEGKTIVIIDIKEYPIKPISYKNRYYIRKANSNHVMSMEEIADEYLKTKNSSWDYYADTTQSFNDISLDKVDSFIKKIEINFNKSFDDNPMQILQKYGLLRDDKLTFGAYLLFVKDFCLISGIQAGRFKTPTDIIDSISLNTDILSEIDELIIFIRKHLMVEYIITGNPQRQERYDYPLDAIREIVLNMVVHRDYRDSSDSVIKIFDDRIEFFNPGGLYDDLTIEQLRNNDYKSKTRNKLIALMFKECGLIEKYGSGMQRIKKLCLEHNIPEPKFQEIQKGFQVTLYKKTTQKTTQKTSKETILELLKINNKLTRESLSKEIGVTSDTIKQHLANLQKEGKLIRVGGRKDGYWKVLDIKQ